MKKHLLGKGTALALSALMLFTLTPGVAMAEETSAESETQNSVEINTLSEQASGACNENVSWSLDSDGTLTISGSGDMEFDDNNPWLEDYSEIIKTVKIGAGITSIESYAFENCINLKEVTFAEESQLTSIGNAAFEACINLESVTIPSTVLSIGDRAFGYYYNDGYKDEGKTELVSGFTITGAENSAAQIYANENNITFESNGTEVDPAKITVSGTCGDKITWTLNLKGEMTISGSGDMQFADAAYPVGPWYDYKNIIKNIVIKDGITNIAKDAFSTCFNLTNITIPTSVTSIEDNAFYCCLKLESIEIPDSVTNMGSYVFEDCSNLKEATLSNSITSIGTAAFAFCTSLESITIPSSVTSIGNFAFTTCNKLTEITIPEGVKEIGNSAFFYIEGLKEVEIPESVETIGQYAFGYYYSQNEGEWEGSYQKYDGFTITGAENSAAQTYANENNITFKATLHKHTMVKVAATNATCGKAGSSAYWTCKTCGKYFKDAEGKTEIEKDSWIIPATGKHSLNSGVVTKKATATANGTITYTCKVCKKVIKTTTIKKATILTAKVATKTVTYAKAKKKAQTLTPITAKSGVGAKITYKVTKYGNSKAKKYLSLNTKTGKVTVKKKTPKGTYKITVKVSAAATTKYAAASKTVTVTIKVK